MRLNSFVARGDRLDEAQALRLLAQHPGDARAEEMPADDENLGVLRGRRKLLYALHDDGFGAVAQSRRNSAPARLG